MKRPFVLFSIKGSKKASQATKKRMEMRMKPLLKECEWLWEATGSCPEQSLGIAVLQRAVLDLITPGIHERDKVDAESWIQSAECSYPLSFSRVVESFTNIPVEEFREKLMAWVNCAKVCKETADGFRFQRS
jgi:hypothetical protein